MRLEAWIQKMNGRARLQPPEKIDDIKQLVVRDNIGQPLAVFMQMSADTIWFARAGEPDFEKALKYMGLSGAVPSVHDAQKDFSSA